MAKHLTWFYENYEYWDEITIESKDSIMRKKIFISSTFVDLIPHRKSIYQLLNGLDVDILGMESFGARKTSPLETCIEELEECDIYIGIISLRYGSVHSICGKSYTQIEYEKAKELGKEICLYLLDESKGVVQAGNIDYGENALRLNSFKNILKSNHTVDFFIDEKDLVIKINNRLKKLLPKSESYNRPQSLDCKLYRYNTDETKWICFLGYHNGKPVEIFNCPVDDEEGILVPRSVVDGKLIECKDGNGIVMYNFIFASKRGFKVILEGINYEFNSRTNQFDKIITNLLRNNVPISVVIETLKDMIIDKNEKYIDWNKEVIKILEL